MNEERTGKCLRQVEHIRGHLWHRYSDYHFGIFKLFLWIFTDSASGLYEELKFYRVFLFVTWSNYNLHKH
jgi:hypothetical protein